MLLCCADEIKIVVRHFSLWFVAYLSLILTPVDTYYSLCQIVIPKLMYCNSGIWIGWNWLDKGRFSRQPRLLGSIWKGMSDFWVFSSTHFAFNNVHCLLNFFASDYSSNTSAQHSHYLVLFSLVLFLLFLIFNCWFG